MNSLFLQIALSTASTLSTTPIAAAGLPEPVAGGFDSHRFWLVVAMAVITVYLIMLSIVLKIERGRTRARTRMFARAAAKLADERIYSHIAQGGIDEPNALANAFNKINENQIGDEEKIEEHRARRRQAASDQAHLSAAADQLGVVADFKILPKIIAQIMTTTFGVRRAKLWLLHNYLGQPQPQKPKLESLQAESKDSSSPQMLFEKAGLFEAACAHHKDADAADNLKFTNRAIIEAVMGRKTVECADVSASPLFASTGAALAAHGFTSCLAIPFLFHERTIGLLELYNDQPFRESEIATLEIFASLACSAVTSAWSTHEFAQSRENLEMKNVELEMTNRKLERSNNRLTQADRLKGEFLANTSHELRTPLNSILGFASLILSGACRDEDEKLQYVKTIHESGERLLRLINDVLDLAKIEAGRMALNLGPADVRPLIDAAHSLLQVQAGARGNRIVVEVPEGPMPLLRVDSSRLHQVLVNLVGNAIKFTKNGTITLRVHPEHIPGFMRLEIEDTGVGVSHDVRSKLFRSFVQGDGSTTRRFGGTGLGLVISKKMIELVGGAIDLKSPGEGLGTTVSLDMPLWSDELEEKESNKKSEVVAEPPQENPLRTAVVIEDYLEYQKYLKDLLESNGWAVQTARTASAGMDLILKANPSAIVLDVHLPCDHDDDSIQSGYDIIHALGQMPHMTSIPVFVVTGMRQEACDRLLSQTIFVPVELWSKPLEEDSFIEALDRLALAAS